MKKYEITATIAISVTTSVLAENEQQAIEIADARTDILHKHFEHGDPSECWVVDDYDGVPCDLRIDNQ